MIAYANALAQLLARVNPATIPSPRVAVLATGNELIEPGEPLALGQIYHSNGYMLAAAAAQAGAKVTKQEVVPDSTAALQTVLQQAAAQSDLILTIGGTALGDHDIARQLQPEVWRLALSPVQRLLVGNIAGVLWLGLPGPPGPALIAFEAFVHPVLATWRGGNQWSRPTLLARLTEPVTRKKTLRLLWARLSIGPDEVWVTPMAKATGIWSSMIAANSLLLVPAGEERLEMGEPVNTWLLA